MKVLMMLRQIVEVGEYRDEIRMVIMNGQFKLKGDR
jgi:hypothetical protein